MIYNTAKAQISDGYNTTAGGDVHHVAKISAPGTAYLRIGDYYGEVAGTYELTVSFKP